MALVGSLLVNVGANTAQFEQGMKRAQLTLGSLVQSFAKVAVAGATLSVAQRALEGIVESGAKIARLESGFDVLTGSSSKSAEILNDVRATSDRLGLSFVDLADQYRALAAASRGTS